MPDGSYYRVQVELAPNQQAVGVYPLSMTGSVLGNNCDISLPGGCSGGGGMCTGGTIEITAIDAANVSFTLVGLENCDWSYASGGDYGGAGLNGSYTAIRCP